MKDSPNAVKEVEDAAGYWAKQSKPAASANSIPVWDADLRAFFTSMSA